ncbi:MAG: nucleotidyltransferase domain-containing protein [Deltaproteobacteria bacterium]|nr:nucleotidyltransferase domain-containing protein [Deltaproteobacteria bacterium]
MKSRLSPKEREAVTEFKKRLMAMFGPRVRGLTLFGSRSRGEGDEDSDVDILILLDQAPASARGRIFEIAADIFLQYEIEISPLVMSEDHFQNMKKRERLLPLEIERDGQSL